MGYKRGDVVLVVYHPPTTGRSRVAKSRPMVVMSSDAYHTERPQDVIAVLITTKVTKYQGTTDYALRDWQAARLHSPSVVRCALATIEQNQIGGKVCSLSAADMQGVEAAIKRAIGL